MLIQPLSYCKKCYRFASFFRVQALTRFCALGIRPTFLLLPSFFPIVAWRISAPFFLLLLGIMPLPALHYPSVLPYHAPMKTLQTLSSSRLPLALKLQLAFSAVPHRPSLPTSENLRRSVTQLKFQVLPSLLYRGTSSPPLLPPCFFFSCSPRHGILLHRLT